MKAIVQALLSPAMRIAIGLVSLMVTLLLLGELFSGYPPDRTELARRLHGDVARSLGGQVAMALRGQGRSSSEVQHVLRDAQALEPAILSVRVVDQAGQAVGQLGEHVRGWHLGPGEASTVENVRIALMANGQPWGEVQVVFRPPRPTTLAGWLRDPAVRWMGFMVLLGLVGFALYLRRVLRHLDPNAAVPERVRAALDTLTEGVLVLDTNGRIMLANQAFSQLHDADRHALTGQDARRLQWLVDALPEGTQALPWNQAVQHKRAVLGVALKVDAPGRPRRELVLNCAPITDGRGSQMRVRGCLASFSDVTELHDRTERLRVALAELSASQEEIERQNAELTIIATRDALTGIFNRRSLMQQAGQRFVDARDNGTPISCIMCDIDHFKAVTDKSGHAGGDQVIQGAAKALTRGLRLGDFAGRYGGEEFCIMLPGGTAEQAMEIAERLREDIEANLGSSLRDHVGVRVTMSFGIAEIAADVADHDMLIDRADQALYYSTKTGRNRATRWAAELKLPV